MPAPDRIKQLITTFEQNINDYRFNKNETELRRQFLDPFFEALGWDVDNKQGKDERHKEVAHEFSVEIDGQQKKADYAFRTEKDIFDFLVEAKKPSVNVESNKDAAFQIRSYGWSAKIPVNILTDFEHLAIYDCRIRPNYAKDDAKTGRIEIIHYKEYIERWDEIAKLFSPDAIRNGALDEYTDGLKSKKGTQEVDDAFLEEIEGWREALAKNIAARNKDKNLNEEQINFAVQMTIDRIIFLRIAEERGMEKDRKLFELIDNTNIYKDLLKFFAQADDRYNSGLFHFKKDKDRENPDTLSQSLEIEDKVLKEIIKDLYYPSPYAFTYIPTEILGSVYERFLGKVIRLTAGGNAKVEEKPEVRKAGGVYYTPSYIVEYIVKNTVGKLLDPSPSPSPDGRTSFGEGSKTPEEVSKIKIVDPACGSGSFLLGAYQFLLDWHLDYYASNQTEKWVRNKTILTADKKTYRLSIDEKKRILLNNIHGVDLDPQAVEVTKLSLLLKVVEDPGQLKMFEEGHILPNLNKNIKNGNALIGTDYFSGQMFNDMEEMKRIKPFDWNTEFPEVFKRGGFDAVIGNPPYVEIVGIEWDDRRYYENIYSVKGRFDLYTLFILKAMQICNKNGYWGFIIPNKFSTNLQFAQIRQNILENQKLNSLLSFDGYQFKNAGVNSIVICCQKLRPNTNDSVEFLSWNKGTILNTGEQNQSTMLSTAGFNFSLLSNEKNPIIESIKNTSMPYDTFFDVKDGIVAGEIKDELFAEKKIDEDSHKLFFGKGLQRYSLKWTDTWVNYKPQEMMKLEIKRKGNKRPGLWMRDKAIFETAKILTRKVATHIIATFDSSGVYYEQTLHGSILRPLHRNYDEKYFLGILNSYLMKFYYQSIVQQEGKLFPQIRINVLKSLPIHVIDFSNASEKSQHDKMVSLVEKMLALHKSLVEAKTPQEKELLQRQITSTDRAIDSLVYELYGLSQEEQDIVEGIK